ncbi:MAG TPA: hypothetical protein VKB26_10565 [Candidatus Acidoferrales bacterium]|nr:hypothetical protein [Candidatus Acidoferrales bacterium]
MRAKTGGDAGSTNDDEPVLSAANGRKMAMRRIQAATLIVALLAVPLALVARADAGMAQECAMACCRGRHVSAAKMKCGRAAKDAQNATCQCAEHGPDYGLNSPLPPFQLSAGAKLPAMRPARAICVAMTISDFAGYFPPPFNPPRA